jgi:hypothetical protein
VRISAGRRLRRRKRTSGQSGFRALSGVNTFYVEVTSACEKRQRCTINAYVVGSRGGKTGQGTITPVRPERRRSSRVWMACVKLSPWQSSVPRR